MGKVKITAIVGTYRKGHIVDSAVDAILASAQAEGAAVEKILLTDKQIEFCTNCRACTQSAGETRGECPMVDDMAEILERIEESDGIVLASPMNFWTVTAITKRFIERLVCFAYWPWGAPAPKARHTVRRKRAVVVSASAAPAPLARLTTSLVKLLRRVAELLGAQTVGVLFIGLAAQEEDAPLSERTRKKAALLGKKLAAW